MRHRERCRLARLPIIGREQRLSPDAYERNGVCAPSRNGVFVLRRKALGAREGSALSHWPRRRHYMMREGALPEWYETQRGSARLRVAPDPKGHAP
jgi:hypothetical protein